MYHQYFKIMSPQTEQFNYKKIRVYETVSASLIVSHSRQIASLLFGFTPDQETYGFANFYIDQETGYWRYRLNTEKLKDLNLFSQTQSEAEDLVKLAFKNANEKIENAIKAKQLPEGFPILFGKYQKIQNTIAIEQSAYSDKAKIWEFHYRIELPSVDYVKPVDDKWEHTVAEEKSIVMGNEIVVRISGNKLLELQYLRLPTKTVTRKKMFNLLGEPDIVGEFQKVAKVVYKAFPKYGQILPFVQSINGELLPITEESVLRIEGVKLLQASLDLFPRKNKRNRNKFSPNRVVWKLGNKNSTLNFQLSNQNGIGIVYDSLDEKYEIGLENNPIQLPRGTKVVIIDTYFINSKEFNWVILFWKGRYREGYIEIGAFELIYTDSDENSLMLFINDSERLLYEIELRKIKGGGHTILNKCYTDVIMAIKKLKTDNNSDSFNVVCAKYYAEESLINDQNNVISINKVISFLSYYFDTFIAQNNVIILPISKDWLAYCGENNVQVESLLLSITKIALYGDFDGEVGNVKAPTLKGYEPVNENIEVVIPFLVSLFDFLQQDVFLNTSPEFIWLKENIEVLQKMKKGSIIVLGNGIWKKGFWQGYAGYIGIQNSYGTICAVPLTTVLIHEFDQGNLEYLPEDTHITPDDTAEVMTEMKEKPNGYFFSGVLGQTINSGDFKTDYLYQCNVYHGIMFLGLFLKKYL